MAMPEIKAPFDVAILGILNIAINSMGRINQLSD